MRTTRNSILITLLSLLVCLSIVACQPQSTYQKSYKVLSGSKVTMETLARSAKDLHKSGVLNDDQLAKAKEAYVHAQTVQGELIRVQSEAIMSGDASKNEQAARLGVAYLGAATQFLNIAISYGLIQEDDPDLITIRKE